MRRALAMMSEGMLSSSTKKAITIASIGWLVFSGTPTPPSDGGDGGYSHSESHDKKILEERRKKIKQNEQEWMLFIKIFTEQCQ